MVSGGATVAGLLAVCRSWRYLAWHTPSLWESIVLSKRDPGRKLALWLEQSQGIMRELYVTAGAARHPDWPLLQLNDLTWGKLRICNSEGWDVGVFFEQHG